MPKNPKAQNLEIVKFAENKAL